MVVAAMCSAVTGCSGEVAIDTPASDTGTADGSTSTVSGGHDDEGVGGALSPGATAGEGEEVMPQTSTVLLLSSVAPIEPSGYAWAVFVEGGPERGQPTCSRITTGACALTECNDGVPWQDLHSAGDITVTGAEPTPLVLVFDNTIPYFFKSDFPLFSGGELLNVAAAGADVPAFQTTLAAPSTVLVSAPVWTDPAQPVLVDTDEPLTVAWSGQSEGDLVVRVSAGAKDLRCQYPASDLTATIPAAALAPLKGINFAKIIIEVRTAQPVVAEDWEILIEAVSLGVTPTSGSAFMPMSFN